MKIHSILAGLIAVSAALVPAAAASAAPAAAAASAPKSSVPQTASSSAVKQDPAQITKLNHQSALPLILEAQKRYTYVMAGGYTMGETFMLNGQEYRYLSEDIGTTAKLIKYLTSVYTDTAAKQFAGKYVVEVNGRLAQLNADGGSLLQFDRATAKMLSMTDVKRSYLLTVPYAAEAKLPNAKLPVNFEKVGSFWRISTAPHVLF
ncbi:DL-endopeptidase inhibitor IseA family protein [Paenibacillus sp. JX-17]|uniref:DL-endopeptidase inhibitor IseA family protein n=1 Tax=Paenibacillus lacisoli TaxID=3064525 RepID=A0ABT9CAS1_9BACL|nr:DL-endopeptidase inhibitor IseA family protein [Paenibacillus sp. JX-17]MDO7906346.1 DL-endopeptidase inhibitor IseA family protein [Paenibacillus sp. JX-17]